MYKILGILKIRYTNEVIEVKQLFVNYFLSDLNTIIVKAEELLQFLY